MKANQIAINSVSTADKPLPELLAAYAGAGFRNVEFALPRVKKWMEQGHSIGDVQALLSKFQLRSIGGFEATVSSFEDEEAKRKNHALHLANAQLLAQLGGGVLVVGTDAPTEKSVAALQTIGKTLRELVEQFPSTVSIAVEFNWSGIVKSLASASIVVDAAAHPRVGILFDPAHFHCTPSKLEHLTPHVVSQILHVHVDDMNETPGDLANCNSDRALPGEGTLDLKTIFGRIEQHGYRGFFSIEMFSEELWALPVSEAAQRCFKSMQTLL
jgi:4-hydroxyphenylpyruvate dioxygenase